jgi:hypothetical protein
MKIEIGLQITSTQKAAHKIELSGNFLQSSEREIIKRTTREAFMCSRHAINDKSLSISALMARRRYLNNIQFN